MSKCQKSIASTPFRPSPHQPSNPLAHHSACRWCQICARLQTLGGSNGSSSRRIVLLFLGGRGRSRSRLGRSGRGSGRDGSNTRSSSWSRRGSDLGRRSSSSRRGRRRLGSCSSLSFGQLLGSQLVSVLSEIRTSSSGLLLFLLGSWSGSGRSSGLGGSLGCFGRGVSVVFQLGQGCYRVNSPVGAAAGAAAAAVSVLVASAAPAAVPAATAAEVLPSPVFWSAAALAPSSAVFLSPFFSPRFLKAALSLPFRLSRAPSAGKGREVSQPCSLPRCRLEAGIVSSSQARQREAVGRL